LVALVAFGEVASAATFTRYSVVVVGALKESEYEPDFLVFDVATVFHELFGLAGAATEVPPSVGVSARVVQRRAPGCPGPPRRRRTA
jgi:hypothetical protein